MNEKITENFVREHFRQAVIAGVITLEEQASADLRVRKALAGASKKIGGNGQGRPEFIIRFKDNDDLVIIVECKADIRRHASKEGDRYTDYAVDGVLLYASFLAAKDFNVIAIAVSGQDQNELKVSHFLQLQGTQEPVAFLGDKLLEPDSYRDAYVGSDAKYKQDYNRLLSYSKTLNIHLHNQKVKESQRSLLISGIIIALEDEQFKAGYSKARSPKSLANSLVETISNQLREADLKNGKLENLNTAYAFIKTHKALSGEKDVLKSIIRDIDEHINSFIKTHQYIDVLGQFYVEFLSYANSDRGLGIVMTPPHITDLFVLLAQVNKDSVVYDNCTGTGGFLISAMRQMIADANGDKRKIESIKKKQLVGVEWQDDIFALACSNMLIHQDGKSNIIHGDCFDEAVNEQVKKHKPNIGFLNPPYSNKKNHIDELEFVLANLEVLQTSGTCIAIVPMTCVTSQKGRSYELKKKLLENHTLEAVFSMPNDLFINSDVNVVTCVIVLTAHVKHPAQKKTYFGLWKDDGFVKSKHRGRSDSNGKWEGIRDRWVDMYMNRKEIKRQTFLKRVGADDEWCAEAFMKADYTKLSKDDFLRTLKSYVVYNILRDEHANNEA